jgi:hypothetical protein
VEAAQKPFPPPGSDVIPGDVDNLYPSLNSSVRTSFLNLVQKLPRTTSDQTTISQNLNALVTLIDTLDITNDPKMMLLIIVDFFKSLIIKHSPFPITVPHKDPDVAWITMCHSRTRDRWWNKANFKSFVWLDGLRDTQYKKYYIATMPQLPLQKT